MPHRNSNPTRLVVIATIIDSGDPGLLCLLRSRRNSLWPDMLSMPGGHVAVERGETPFKAALRIFEEETGMGIAGEELKLASLFTKRFKVDDGKTDNMNVTLYSVQKLGMRLEDIILSKEHSSSHKVGLSQAAEYARGNNRIELDSGHPLAPVDSVIIKKHLPGIAAATAPSLWKHGLAGARRTA